MTVSNEYSVGGAYRGAAGLFLILSPYFYYRFFADLFYGQDGKHWQSILHSVRTHPGTMSFFWGFPVLSVLVGLLLLTYRFAGDLLFASALTGVVEIAEIAKKGIWGERVIVQISGRRMSLTADQEAGLLLDKETLGRKTLFKIGGFNKVLYLRVE